MNFFQDKSAESEKLSLDKTSKVGNNNATTKIQAVKPNRHTLAIFVPSLSTGTKHCHNLNLNGLTVYDGLREPNKIPVLGNKFRHLVLVVESRCSMLATTLTKIQGVFQ